MRKPAGTGFCWPMISFTLLTALAVRVTGGVFLVTSVVTSGFDTVGTVVVAIGISLALKLLDYSKYGFRHKGWSGNHPRKLLCDLDATRDPEVALFPVS